MKGSPRVKGVLLYSLFLQQYARAIEVAPDSGCAVHCVNEVGPSMDVSDRNASITNDSDLVCEDSEFTSTTKWVRCLRCEAGSDQESAGKSGGETETDVFWFLFNLRYNLAWCLFGVGKDSNNSNAPEVFGTCDEACSDILQPITFDVFTVTKEDRYGYCSNTGEAFKKHASSCVTCLQNAESSSVLANYIKALQVACNQRPPDGEALDLGFDLFEVNSTATSAPTSTATSAASSGDEESGNKTKIGIGVGVGVGGAIVLGAGIGLLLWVRRRRHARHSDDTVDPAPGDDDTKKTLDLAQGDGNHDHDNEPQLYEAPEVTANPPELSSGQRWEAHELDVHR